MKEIIDNHKYEKELYKKGITLIALIITIIVAISLRILVVSLEY